MDIVSSRAEAQNIRDDVPASSRFFSRESWIWMIFCVALFVGKLIFSLSSASAPISDELTYLSIAENLNAGRGFESLNSRGATAFVMPGYPLLLAALLKASSGGLTLVYIFQVMLSAVMAGAYGGLIQLWTGRQRLTRLTAALIFVLPPFFLFPHRLLTEVAFSAWLALALLAWESIRQRPHRTGMWGALGLFHALAFLTRPVTVVLTPLILGWVLVGHRSRDRKMWGGAVFAIVIIGALWMPWVMRNYRAFGAFVPLTTSSGFTLMGGSLDDFTRWEEYSNAAMSEAGIKVFNEDEVISNVVITRAARERIADDVPAYLWRSLKRCWRFWLSEYKDLSGRNRSFGSCVENREWGILLAKLILAATSTAIMLLAGLSVPLAIWRPKYAPYSLLIVYFTASHALLLPIPRYSAPISGLVVALGIAGLHELWSWFEKKHSRSYADAASHTVANL